MENLLQISVLFSLLFLAGFFPLLKKMLASALGGMRENSNNARVFLGVSVLTFRLHLFKWNARMEVQWALAMCVFTADFSGVTLLSVEKCLTQSPQPSEGASAGVWFWGNSYQQVPQESLIPLKLENHWFAIFTPCCKIWSLCIQVGVTYHVPKRDTLSSLAQHLFLCSENLHSR